MPLSNEDAAIGDAGMQTVMSAPALVGLRDGLDLTLTDFIARSKQVRVPPELWQLSLAFYRGRGVRMLSYHYYGGGLDGLEPMIKADGFPDDWVEHYVEKQLFRVDPIPELASRSTEPFFWSDIANLTQLLAVEEAYLEELRAAKLGEGLGVPVFGPLNCDGYIGLGFGGTRPALTPRAVRELQVAGQVGHLTYCGMVAGERQDRAGLSPREREVLHWIARGKSNGVISDIMGVSPHTVDTHVRRIFDKLGVADRTSAAIKGLGAGLLMQVTANAA